MEALTKEQIRENVAANFRHIRLQFEMTSKVMADKLGLNEKTYGAIEEGRALTPHHIYLMSQYTEISIDTLMTRRIDLTA